MNSSDELANRRDQNKWKRLGARATINAGLTLVSIIFCFALAEAGFRLYLHFVDKSNITSNIDSTLQLLPDSKRVYGLKPGLDLPVYTNAFGFRGKEISLVKPPNTYRIVMLGDSVTFGNSVVWNETFSYLLESHLNRSHKQVNFEVLNLAVSGYNTAQELATLREKGLAFSPDLIILNICLNDSDPAKEISKVGLINTTSISKLSDINIRTIVDISHVLTFMKETFRNMFQNSDYVFRKLNSPELFINTRVRETAWETMKQDMDEIFLDAKKNAIPLIVVIYPYSSQIGLSPEERVPQSDLMQFWGKKHVPVLDPSPLYRNAEKNMFTDGTLHLSVYGHSVIAKGLADYLAELGYPR
jgi:lysophospholipase L1-like esterase